MPRWDKTRDYYADLGLSSAASTDDAKKQFRKLALKWHPDRNPGRESEVNPKFQTIQSAHEILSDPILKQEYDDARKAYTSRFPKASGVRGNPWQDFGKQYQPPPTRTATHTSSRAHSGAQRYASFTNNMPRPPKPPPREDPQARKAYADAWENMRRSNTTRRAPPTPGRAPTSAARDTKASDSESAAPRTAYQQQKAQASFGARRTGFTPRSPGMADEPPVTGKNYFTTRTHSHMPIDPDDDDMPTNGGTPTASANIDPLAQFREKVWDKRQSTPYHTPGGEKTSLFDDGPGLGRTASTRSPFRSEMPGAFPQARPRSSSTPKSSDNDGGSEDSTIYGRGASTAANRQTSNGANTSQPRRSDRYKPNLDPNDAIPKPPSGATGNAATSATNASKSGGDSAQAGTNGPSVYGAPVINPSDMPKSQHRRASSKASKADHKPYVYRNGNSYHPYPLLNTQHPSSGGVKPRCHNLYPLEEAQRSDLNCLIGLRSVSSQKLDYTYSKTDGYHVAHILTSEKHVQVNADGECSSSFSFSAGNDAPSKGAGTNGLSKHSTDSINTRFVEDELPDDWKFSAGTASTNEPQTPTKGRPQSRSRSRRQGAKPRPAEADRMPSMQEGLGSATGQGFFAGVWNDKIGSQHFVPQPSRSTSNSPTRRTNPKKAKPVKMTAGTAGLVDEEESEGWQESRPTSSDPAQANTDGATAMDIDSPPPEKVDETPKASQTNGARKIPVEPYREEWRAGNVNGVRTKSTSPMRDENSTKGQFTQPAPQPPPIPTPMPAPNTFPAPHAGSEDTEEFRTTFADFKNVEPFANPAPTGLKDFNDLKSTLPFQSRPSEQIPLEKEQAPKFTPLQFPTPPVAPRLPVTAVTAGVRPNQVQFRKYAQDFYQYMEKWESFNDRVMDHFANRQENFKVRRQLRGAAWLDTTQGGKDAASEYLTELEQDRAVRQQWENAYADHQVKIVEFVKFRDQVK